MPTWDAKQYLRFEEQRTRPCRDLADRIAVAQPRAVIDLGCGPGNSTAVVAARWPAATISGLDSSADMITAARAAHPTRDYRVGEIGAWAASAGEHYDVVFSNAALQWVSEHGLVLPQLMKRVGAGGAFAFQVPGNYDAPAHQIMRELAQSRAWRKKFAGGVREWHVHDLPAYYDILSPSAASLDLWATEYIHVMDDAAAIVQWYKGTGLRPFLDALPTAGEKESFEAEYTTEICKAYPAQAGGKVLFPFRRLFVVAYAA
jgi:trans-aconitate 2-methyltransferase